MIVILLDTHIPHFRSLLSRRELSLIIVFQVSKSDNITKRVHCWQDLLFPVLYCFFQNPITEHCTKRNFWTSVFLQYLRGWNSISVICCCMANYSKLCGVIQKSSQDLQLMNLDKIKQDDLSLPCDLWEAAEGDANGWGLKLSAHFQQSSHHLC